MNKSILKQLYGIFTFLTVLLFSHFPSFSQVADLGKSYINVTKGASGGTVETGDVLEIRASFVVRSGTFDSCAYFDAIPAGTSYIANTIRVLTNEGKIYKQFTDAMNDDEGWKNGAVIRINLGYNQAATPATAFRRGRVANTHKPSFYGSACIMIASFQVTVTAASGTNISTGGGSMTYKNGVNPIVTFTFPANTLKVYPNYGICSNTIGVNALGTESNGTFGSGKPRNRGTSANVPPGYTYKIFDVGTPNDYSYGVPNNTSTLVNYTTLNTWPKPDGSSPSHRVFNVWDIIGDHTGAASPALGNPATDTAAGNGGYMLVINAAYKIDSAFQHTITGLCPNTYYEISCWMRNICSKCGCDSNGKGATNAAGPPFYIPTGPGDSSGVAPNLTFELDGIDYYTTGNLTYNGRWVKKGFTFLTGPVQTSFTLKFFNNAPGGGGNDWALDDIAVSTCSPNMTYSPTVNPIVCEGNTIKLNDTVRSFFNNYTYYKWQRSTDNGTTWTDITGALGPSSPYWNGSAWEYVTSYTIPPAWTTLADSGNLYRVIVATTLSNLSNPSCSFTESSNIITLSVIDCGEPLNAHLLSFTGSLNDKRVTLNWITTGEDEPLQFDIEKIDNNSAFKAVFTIDGFNNGSNNINSYAWTDPELLNGKAYYRLKIYNSSGKSFYSKIISFSANDESLDLLSIFNPFNSELIFDVYSTKNAMTEVRLIDRAGKTVKIVTLNLIKGVNSLRINDLSSLPPGIYIFRMASNNEVVFRKLLKQ